MTETSGSVGHDRGLPPAQAFYHQRVCESTKVRGASVKRDCRLQQLSVDQALCVYYTARVDALLATLVAEIRDILRTLAPYDRTSGSLLY